MAVPHEFRSIADSAPVLMWASGLDRRRRFVNRAYTEFLGCDVATALEFEWRTIVHPEDEERMVAARLTWESALHPVSLEARYRRSDGAWRWLRSVAQPSFAHDGAHNGFVGVVFDVTEAREAELALAASEHQLAAYVDQTAAGFAESDLAGRFTRVNDRFCEICGHSREALLGRTMQSITHPDDLPRNLPLFEAAARDGTPYQHEKRYLRPDGSTVWVNNSVSLIRRPDGAPAGVLAVCVDVTEHRRIAGELRDAEERLRLATEGAGIGTWDWDLVRMTGAWSPEMLRIVGAEHEPDGPIEQRWRVVHPEDRESFLRTVAARVRDGGELATEVRIVRPDGELRWVAMRGVSLRDAHGRPVRMLGTVQDVTDRVRARDELERLNRTLESEVAERTAERDGMWRLSRDLLLVLDPRLRIIAANPAVAELTGYAPEEVAGEMLKTLIHRDDWPTALAAIGAGRRVPVRDVEARLIARDGTVREVSWTATPEAGRAYVSGRDVTADRQRMRELLAAQEALRQSQKLEAIGQLTGGVAHDFNNLLSPIIGSLDLLRHRGIGGPREQKLIAAALQSADRARVLVQRLLAFARRQPLSLRAIGLRALLDDLHALLRSTLGPAVELRIAVEPELPAVVGDANQLEMAILNLAVNARDAMPQGGTLDISAEDDGEGFVSLAVTDSGIGMDEATLARAAEPFFSSKGIGKGTGLGLSMVDGLTAQLGGSLDIASRPGEGTTVRLRLPVASEHAERSEPAPQSAHQTSVSGRLLLVEDEPLVRAATAEILRDRGFEVYEADTAADALAGLADGTAVDCVVTDHLMPGMSGVELAKALALLRPELPVLLLTGYAEVDAFGAGQPFLAKPFHADELVGRIAALLREAAKTAAPG